MQPPRPFRTILAALLLAVCAVSAQGQTIKTLGYNTTNGQVIANTGTNVLTFSNASFNSVILPNGTFVDEGQFSAPQFAGALFSFEEQRINQNGVNVIQWDTNGAVTFGNAATTRTNLGLGLAALTNTSNVTTMRALAGSTNTNEPYSGTVALTNTNVLTFSNGVLLKIQ